MLIRKTLFWLFVLAVAALITYPILWLIFGSEVTLRGSLQYLASERILRLLLRTVGLGLTVMVASTAIGTCLAFLAVRTDIGAKGLISGLVMASYMTPSFLLAFAYVLMLSPNVGFLNRFSSALFGFKLLNIQSFAGFALLATFEATPVVFLTVSNVLTAMHRPLEDGARALGAKPWRVIRTVTLPLAMPGVAAAALLVFVLAISLYGVPAILGIPVITTEIQALFSWPPKFARAASLALALTFMSLVGVYLHHRLLRGQERFTTVTGKWVPPEPFSLGKWRWLIQGAVLLYLSLAVVVPYGTLLAASLSKSWTDGFHLSNITLYNYQRLFRDQYNVRAMVNSLELATGAASIGVILAFIISYIEVRSVSLKGSKILDYLAMIPWGVPSIALGAGMILAFTHPPVLYGTKWILLVAYLIKFLPLAVRSTNSALRQVSRELEQGARITGASDVRTIWDITVPLVRGGLMGGWLLMFFPSLNELSSSILLVSPRNETLSLAALTAWESVNFEGATALAVVSLALALIPWLAVRRFRQGIIRIQ